MTTIQKELERLIAEQLSEGKLDSQNVENVTRNVVQDELLYAADRVLASMKEMAPETLKYNRELEEGFRQRNYNPWATGFDLLEMLLAVAEETGDAINRAE